MLTTEIDNWVTVPTNSTLTIHKQTVMIHPIIDEYYNHNPSYSRNSKFAKDKGLVSSAPGAAQAMTPATGGTFTPGDKVITDTAEVKAVRMKLEEVQRKIALRESASDSDGSE